MYDDHSSAELRALFFNVRETRPASHIYVLLDNACPVSSDHALHADSVSNRTVQRDRLHVGDAGASPEALAWQPMLLQLHRSGESGYADDELIELTWQNATERCASINGAYVAAWIASDQAIDALASHLARNSDVFDLSQGRKHKMQLHQPYRMALLSNSSEAGAFLSSHLRGIHAWMFVDAASALRTIKVDSTLADAERAPHPPLSLCRALQRVPMGRRVLLGMKKAELPVPDNAEQVIDDLLVIADKKGLTHAEDVIFFALNTLTLSPAWYDHPQARALIQRSSEDSAPLVGLFSELPRETVEEIGTYRPHS
jgi:hypothetical protein